MQTQNHNLKILTDWLNDECFYSESALGNEENLIKQGENKALKLFREAFERIPAYKDFLKKHNINPDSIKNISDFKKIPSTTKENYIEKYAFKDRCWDGNLDDITMISASSGTTGEPHFWPRNLVNEIEGACAHEFIFKDVLKIEDKKTLFINGFAMGNWIAGTYTSACVNLIAWKGYPITLMSPGNAIDAIVEILSKIAPEYEIVIMSGHAPVLKEIVEKAVKKGVDFKRLNLKLFGTGQAITENWRKYLLKIINSDNYCDAVNVYGSADAALMGFETSFSISLRKILSENFDKSKEIFHDERLPSIYNFDPRLIYFEEEGKELHITKNSGCPLIKYNIQDEGGIILFKDMADFFKNQEINIADSQKAKFPFVYLFGRDKFMVKIYGANVYSEHVQHALNHEALQPLLTGRYVLEMGYDENQNPEMICRVELNPEIEQKPELINLIQHIFVKEVKKINSEYNFVLDKLGDKVKPRIILHEHGYEKYFPIGKTKKNA